MPLLKRLIGAAALGLAIACAGCIPEHLGAHFPDGHQKWPVDFALAVFFSIVAFLLLKNRKVPRRRLFGQLMAAPAIAMGIVFILRTHEDLHAHYPDGSRKWPIQVALAAFFLIVAVLLLKNPKQSADQTSAEKITKI